MKAQNRSEAAPRHPSWKGRLGGTRCLIAGAVLPAVAVATFGPAEASFIERMQAQGVAGIAILFGLTAALVVAAVRQSRTEKLLRNVRAAAARADTARAIAEAELDVMRERQRADEERERARVFLNTVVENTPAILTVKTIADRRYVLINKAAEGTFGLPREAMLNCTDAEIFPPEQVRAFEDQDRRVLDGKSNHLVEEHAIDISGFGMRYFNTRKLAVAGEDGKPKYLLSASEDITERRRAEARIAHMARHDALTDLPNRVLFREHLRDRLASIVRKGDALAVLCLDLDHFQDVNDTLGHEVGDQLLRQVSERLRSCVGVADTVARLGGDEFAVLQVGVLQPQETAALTERLIEALSAPYSVVENRIVIGLSLGIAMGPADGIDPDQLLRNADLALYRAKRNGRGTFHFFEPAMDAQAQARRALEVDLREAVQHGAFELHYQPLLDLNTGRISGFEALMRWNHPQRGFVSPAEFIRVAEELGLIVRMGDWALRQACEDAQSWPPGLKVAVNLSPIQFKGGKIVAAVMSALAYSGLKPDRLEIEITESVLLDESSSNLETLHQLRALGVRLALDDFGTGYSSLSYVRSFPFNKLKLDRSFIAELSKEKDSAIVRAVASLGRSLSMVTTAEGVENEAQLEKLRLEGFTEAQGFFVSRPKPLSDLQAVLAERGFVSRKAA